MYLSKIYPSPESFSETASLPYRFGAHVHLTVGAGVSGAVVENFKALWRKFSFTASELEVTVSGLGWYCAVGTPVFEVDTPEYYALKTGESGALLRAVSEKALADGFATLVQLITPVRLGEGEEQLFLCPAEIADKPAVSFRSMHICVFPETELSTLEKAIELAGFLKFTHIVLEFWGTYAFETNKALYWPNHCFTREHVKGLCNLCRAYGMEVIPMVNCFGHASQSRGGMGRHTILNQNPRLQMYFEPDGWTWCLSNPDTYKLLGDMRDELCEVCGDGAYFHVGFDEADSFASCDLCKSREPNELLAEFINHMTEDICKMGRRPIMWHDMFINRTDFKDKTEWPVVANGEIRGTGKALDLLDRRIIIADWQYSYKSAVNPTTPFFMEKGFDTILCPWDELSNIRGLCDSAKKLNAYGIMLTTWHHLPAFLRKMYYAANYMWQSGKDGYAAPELNDAFAILRRVHNAPTFEESGWNKFEVEQ